MHSRYPPILHRDLKSHNIFVTAQQDKLVAKVGDWGSAKALALSATKSMTHGVGTACWIAPEVITNTRFSKESDVYAYAIVLWEVYTRKEVYERLSAAQIISKVAYEQLRPPIPLNCPWNKLMIACWICCWRRGGKRIVCSRNWTDIKQNLRRHTRPLSS
jgi:serine/threonine protein kinase